MMIQRLIAATLLVPLAVFLGTAAGSAQQTSERLALTLENADDRATVAQTIETAHAVSDVLRQQIGEMEDFRRRPAGFMFRDGTGARFILPESEAEGLAASLGLDLWINDPSDVRHRLQERARTGSDLDRAMFAAQQALFAQIDGPDTRNPMDFSEMNAFLTDFVHATLVVIDENNRADFSIEIDDVRDEFSRLTALLEAAEFRLAEIELAAAEAEAEIADETVVADDAASENAPAVDWRSAMAQRGVELPVGVSLINPEPSMSRACKAPAETPIWILVADGSVCSDPWAKKGSGDYEGISGDWCVWCPANMYWRSGWGCCFPE